MHCHDLCCSPLCDVFTFCNVLLSHSDASSATASDFGANSATVMVEASGVHCELWRLCKCWSWTVSCWWNHFCRFDLFTESHWKTSLPFVVIVLSCRRLWFQWVSCEARTKMKTSSVSSSCKVMSFELMFNGKMNSIEMSWRGESLLEINIWELILGGGMVCHQHLLSLETSMFKSRMAVTNRLAHRRVTISFGNNVSITFSHLQKKLELFPFYFVYSFAVNYSFFQLVWTF